VLGDMTTKSQQERVVEYHEEVVKTAAENLVHTPTHSGCPFWSIPTNDSGTHQQPRPKKATVDGYRF